MNTKQTELLWHLLNANLVLGGDTGSLDRSSARSISELEWPNEIDAPLRDYLNGTPASVGELGIAVAGGGYLPALRHVLLVAALVEKRVVTIQKALSLLESVSTLAAEKDERVQRVRDVLWLIKEDEKGGFMKVDQDDLLESTLHKVLREAG